MPNPFVEGQPTQWVVGWSFGSFFHSIVKSFDHIIKHVAAALVEPMAMAFGLPPGTIHVLTELLMHAHAGNPKARAQVEHLAKTQPGMKQALTQISLHLRQHPHFAHFQAHAKAQGQKAALHGVEGARRRRRVGDGMVHDVV